MRKKILKTLIMFVFVFFLGVFVNAAETQYLSIDINSGTLYCTPKVNCSSMEITLSAPNGQVYSKTFTGGGSNYVSISELSKGNVCEGSYTFEVKLYPLTRSEKRVDI